jgi:hypothetical protein
MLLLATNPMELNLSRETKRCSSTKEIPCVLWIRKIRYRMATFIATRTMAVRLFATESTEFSLRTQDLSELRKTL